MTRTSHGDFSWWIPTRPTSLADSIVTDEDVAFPIRASRHDTVDLSAAFNDRVTEIFKPAKYLTPRSPFVSLALPSHLYLSGHRLDDIGRIASLDPKFRFQVVLAMIACLFLGALATVIPLRIGIKAFRTRQ